MGAPSLLGTVGGVAGGLGSSGGVGGQIPSNSSAANSAARSTVNPSISQGEVGAAQFSLGPFSVAFPGANVTPPDSINSPGLGTFGSMLPFIGIGALLLVFMAFFLLRK